MRKIASLALLLIVLLEISGSPESLRGKTSRLPAVKPKLVLAIVVDQFRYDYLLRFRSDFREGFERLLTHGAVFVNARYEHYPTFTSVGHSVFLSGAFPSVSGIIGNAWYDRDRGRNIRSVFDDSVKTVGGSGQGASSARNLLVSTLGDEMKIAAQGKCRVIGMSLKDYAGILATGHMADAVYWFDGSTGDFVTSTYYVSALPEWIKDFNAQRPADRYKGQDWMGTRLPSEPGPKLYGSLPRTPFGNCLLEDLAETAVKSEQLGRRGMTDLLVLSFSANDYVGHQYGPDSPQVRDIADKTDQVLGKLFRFLDSQIGLQNVLVVLTADHGVSPLPEINRDRRMPGGRMAFREVSDAVTKALTEKFGEGKWIVSTSEETIYLNWDLIKSKKLSNGQVEAEAARAAGMLPHVFRIYTRTQLVAGTAMEDMVGRRVMNGFSERRGADLYVLLDPYYIFGSVSTTHGTPFGYDTHVPLIFMGSGIKAGRYYGTTAVNDVAPTLATLVGVEIPSGSSGRILSEMFTNPLP